MLTTDERPRHVLVPISSPPKRQARERETPRICGRFRHTGPDNHFLLVAGTAASIPSGPRRRGSPSKEYELIEKVYLTLAFLFDTCLQAVAPDALWEASDIVADIQEAYELAVAA